MSNLNLHVFGTPQITLAGNTVQIKRRKALALLIYLAVTGTAHHRDTLATLLWPAASQQHARAALRRRLTILVSLGLAAYKADNISLAQQCLVDALQSATQKREFLTHVEALPLAALLLLGQDKPAQAVEIYALALCYPRVANSQWFADVVGRQMVVAAAGLPPEVVATAQRQGNARDLWATALELLAMFRS